MRPGQAFGTVLLPLVVLVVGYWWAPPAGNLDFYSTCSQIIPVILLALVVEFRYLGPLPRMPYGKRLKNRRANKAMRWLIRVSPGQAVGLVMMYLLLGEMICLVQLANGDIVPPDPFLGRAVFAAIAAGFTAILAAALNRREHDDDDD